jgi:protein-S-isoprenylcysteine O-methyltransferase Ste14
MPLFPKPYADFVQRLRVPSGFLFAAVFIWLSRPNQASLLWGLPAAAAGLALRAWAAGHLRKNIELTTSGPYAWLRNPLYLGTLLAVVGCVIAARRIEVAVLAAAIYFLIYTPVMEQEEQHLRELFPGYSEYARRVPLLIPRPPVERSAAKFDPAVYRKNREHKALAGFLAVYGFLIAKMLLA